MKLARSSTIFHELGGAFETPILIPSFSSKGFGLTSAKSSLGFNKDDQTDERMASSVSSAIGTCAEVLTESILISAFDVAQGLIPDPKNFPVNPELFYVDSGGYEVSQKPDFSELCYAPPFEDEWTPEAHKTTLELWPDHLPAVFVSFDRYISVEEQLEHARVHAATFPNQLSCFLIKPERKTYKHINLNRISEHVNELKHFDIIGVTEKELDNSLGKRMKKIADLRIMLDEANVSTPIHVFGSLDPITSCLFFLSGAELFDGLTWLRMAYKDGQAIYKQNYGAEVIGLNQTDDNVKAKTLFDNIFYLQKLQAEMKEFASSHDFTVFEHNKAFLKKSYKNLCSKFNTRLAR